MGPRVRGFESRPFRGTPLSLMVKQTVSKTVNACSSRAGGAKYWKLWI